RVEILKGFSQSMPIFTDAREMDVGREASRSRRGADADRVVAHGAAGVAGDAAGCDLRKGGQPRGNFEQPRLAGETRRYQLHHVAEAPGVKRRGQGIRHAPSSLRTMRVPSTMAQSFAKATSRGRCRRPQSGFTPSRSGGTTWSAFRMR